MFLLNELGEGNSEKGTKDCCYFLFCCSFFFFAFEQWKTLIIKLLNRVWLPFGVQKQLLQSCFKYINLLKMK